MSAGGITIEGFDSVAEWFAAYDGATFRIRKGVKPFGGKVFKLKGRDGDRHFGTVIGKHNVYKTGVYYYPYELEFLR